ncbi:MAG: DUF1565 domain-containing protein [Trueperaceae bacterium]|nr:DUF1565 domain-containing protein [Trueperaceae bacterium]
MRFSKALLYLSGFFILLLLAACPGPDDSSTSPGFNLSILNDELELFPGETATVQIRVLRKGDFQGEITLELSSLPNFSASLNSIAEGENASEFDLSTSADPGTYTFTLKASSGQISESASLAVTVLTAPVTVEQVSIAGYEDSLQIRQGAGEIMLELTGSDLDKLSEPKLGDLALTLANQSKSAVQLAANIPHGLETGSYTLSFLASGQVLELDQQIVITPLYVSPDGNDKTGKGTTDLPFRSLSFALKQADSGDRIQLAAGEYSTAANEVWPVWTHEGILPGGVANDGLNANVPEGVSIQGEGATTILKGEGIGSQTLGLVFAGNAQLANVLLQDFEYALLARAGILMIENTRINSSAGGLWAYGTSTVTVSGESEFSGSVMGVGALNEATVNLLGTQLSFGLFGLGASENAKLLLESVKVFNNAAGIGVLGQANVRLEGVEAFDNGTGMSLSGGIVRVRDSSFNNNQEFGIRVLEGLQKLDLGTSADAGNNELNGNGTFQFLDARPARAQPGGVVIEMSHTKLSSAQLTPGLYAGIYSGTNKTLMIAFKNNLVQVY